MLGTLLPWFEHGGENAWDIPFRFAVGESPLSIGLVLSVVAGLAFLGALRAKGRAVPLLGGAVVAAVTLEFLPDLRIGALVTLGGALIVIAGAFADPRPKV